MEKTLHPLIFLGTVMRGRATNKPIENINESRKFFATSPVFASSARMRDRHEREIWENTLHDHLFLQLKQLQTAFIRFNLLAFAQLKIDAVQIFRHILRRRSKAFCIVDSLWI